MSQAKAFTSFMPLRYPASPAHRDARKALPKAALGVLQQLQKLAKPAAPAARAKGVEALAKSLLGLLKKMEPGLAVRSGCFP